MTARELARNARGLDADRLPRRRGVGSGRRSDSHGTWRARWDRAGRRLPPRARAVQHGRTPVALRVGPGTVRRPRHGDADRGATEACGRTTRDATPCRRVEPGPPLHGPQPLEPRRTADGRARRVAEGRGRRPARSHCTIATAAAPSRTASSIRSDSSRKLACGTRSRARATKAIARFARSVSKASTFSRRRSFDRPISFSKRIGTSRSRRSSGKRKRRSTSCCASKNDALPKLSSFWEHAVLAEDKASTTLRVGFPSRDVALMQILVSWVRARSRFSHRPASPRRFVARAADAIERYGSSANEIVMPASANPK